ncbi:Coproporphyrinogen III oxidase OS=Tsukamurella paurometabola (strain ATCC 8368 / DSM / CCUG 35730 / CIP 100753 / JCM 10117 / KCTC 9821 / NBRC 16120 / NCIMB 702349 / NCTC 13040) OX=521096 GN=Tpau_1893 PE=3 SV=1 [Tsukamurella paurometabola]|uniref:Coproporphyrinogen III oxidase n=1 Tax=Tsukamurella paurometabola (strain ATCC 8368 / DSM 20162 / CCUG 35730 / CIP 100753 / JCM 10117 / KCTC 9821 / NBRC 16120 / NCIMB 702349 / NCTC 13040) TaxID=521096 RepID=D5UN09_TSUPD|nr:protoporphyrinogen oxidase [Tsukamurella paurometabola]ADG78506.1 protoporphyrinogen oxidase [Tsukamurella paurometabola DSM 20162]SUP31963.1 Protoporphyrinogen oxidase [Tsukamurella paurometabola]
MSNIAVVGAGISGLVAALRLEQAGARVTVFESGNRVGGKLRSETIGGTRLDVGAEAFVQRRPEVLDLAAELGLADEVVAPAGRRPALFSDGALRGHFGRTLMGVPVDADEVRLPMSWKRGGDSSIGDLVRSRFGDEVVERSVDPMVSGVFAAHADDVSVRAALPALADRLDQGTDSLSTAVRDALGEPTDTPVFGTFRGGYQQLLDALAERLGDRIMLGAPVPEVRPQWSLRGSMFDAVVLAVPAPQVGRLVSGYYPELAAAVGKIPAASSALVTLRLPDDTPLPDLSGVLVASREQVSAKAITLSGRKWDHLPDGAVRLSFGRLGVSRIVDDLDAGLIAAAREDLATVLGVTADPTAVHVQRWYEGIPVYLPGHRDTLAAIDAATPAGLVLAGAYFDGVGVPACIARAEAAAASVIEQLS